jgi:RNA polymerase sigma factor (sigma-70 family)
LRRCFRDSSKTGITSSSFPTGTTPADQLLERHETRTTVRACIKQLPDNYRTVLILRDIEELTTEEAASALGMTRTAVKVRLHRARQALATLLRKQYAKPTVGIKRRSEGSMQAVRTQPTATA